MADIRIGLDAIICHFDVLEDPRSSINRLHPFASVVVIAMMGILAGVRELAELAASRRDLRDCDRTVYLRRERQDGSPHLRQEKGPGSAALGECLGQRVLSAVGAGRVRQEVKRNHGDS